MEKLARVVGAVILFAVLMFTILAAQGCNAVSGLGRDITAISTSVQDHYADDRK